MGWTSTHKPSYIKLNQYLKEMSDYEDEKRKIEVLEVKSYMYTEDPAAYMAIKDTDKLTGESSVSAVVVLFRFSRGYYNFNYKTMGEEAGPYLTFCPESLLKKLTPTKSEYAKKWRASCWEHLKEHKRLKGIKVGKYILLKDKIKFQQTDEPLGFFKIKKITRNELYLTYYGRPYTTYRLSKPSIINAGFEVIDLDAMDKDEYALLLTKSPELNVVLKDKLARAA